MSVNLWEKSDKEVLLKAYYTYDNKTSGLHLKQYAYYINSYKYNWHKDIELLLVLNGEIEVNKNGESHVMQKDDVILINSNMGHATMARKPDSIAMVIRINLDYFSAWLKNYKNIHFKCVSNSSTRNRSEFLRLTQAMKDMVFYTDFNNEFNTVIYESLFYQIIGELMRSFQPETKLNNDTNPSLSNERVMKIVAYLDENYKEKITLDSLVAVTGYNKSYISQIMKQALGINYYEYLTRVRMREAIFELTNTERKISDIAYENGFSDIKAFNTGFKERFGKTPGQYRKMLINKHKIINSSDHIYIDSDLLKELVAVSERGIECNNESNDLEKISKLKNCLSSEIDEASFALKNSIQKLNNLKNQLPDILF